MRKIRRALAGSNPGLPQPLLQHGQRLAYWAGQRLGALGRHHLAPAHHEQGIVQRRSQPPQRMTDGGLGGAAARRHG